MPIYGQATPAGTLAFQNRSDAHAQHYRKTPDDLIFSSIGIGTYMGSLDTQTDQEYIQSIRAALKMGVNVIDTAINYRLQLTEKAVGKALKEAIQAGDIQREEVVLGTKGGFLPFHPSEFKSRYIETGICQAADLVANCHCLTPGFLEDQLNQSLKNLGVETIDIYYLHNPETQLPLVGKTQFLSRVKQAFQVLEQAVKAGKIAAYGFSTWNGFRVKTPEERHSLEEILACARAVAGRSHHFKVVQLPLNLAMPEALLLQNHHLGDQWVSFLESAQANAITVMASSSILQAQLTSDLPHFLAEIFPECQTDAQRAIQFTRSAPGITTALVGMSHVRHVHENLDLRKIAPATQQTLEDIFIR